MVTKKTGKALFTLDILKHNITIKIFFELLISIDQGKL